MAIWSGKSSTKKYQVKVKGLKLEGLTPLLLEDQRRVKLAIEVRFEGPQKFGFSSFYKKSHQVESFFTKEIEIFQLGDFIEWNDIGFDKICSFSISSKDPSSFSPWILSFNILYGECEESSSKSLACGKMQVLGKARLNLGELATKEQIEHNIHIPLELDGFYMKQEQPSLQVTMSFTEMRNTSHSRTLSHDSYGLVQNSDNSPSFLRRANSQGFLLTKEKTKKNKTRLFGKQLSLKHSVESSLTFNSESDYVVVASSGKNGESNSVTESRSSVSSETQLDLEKKGGFWKWKRRKSMKKADMAESSYMDAETSSDNPWEEKELFSRDEKTKLKANVFFASFDQRSSKASGESACAAIVAVIAHWLQLYPDSIFSGPEFDRLITEGSSEWRKLCKNESNNTSYDQHFDLETILGAQLRPLAILPNNSRFGFFQPELFDHLKGAASFDEIWAEINTNVDKFDSKVYIVRWNEHFFILKIEFDANYIIDSLGERLYEGCNQAYVLKFDDSSLMYEKEHENGEYKVIYKGKECCREYMKRFLAAIPLRELKEEEAKGKNIDAFVLYKRLQIDFHLSSHSSTANSSMTGSPNEAHFGDDIVIV